LNTKNKTIIFCLLIMLSLSLITAISAVQSQEETRTYTAYGPIGTGPYVYMGYDPATFTNRLVKNENYWNKAALESAGTFGVQEYYVQFIEGSDAAISALKAGDVDVLDSQYHLERELSSIQQPWGDSATYDAFGVQELGFNNQHPVFGTGVDTPLGQADPSRAAEAARYVRQAMSHLIPRQEIIDTILGGAGSPGITTPVLRVSAGFDTTLEPYSYNVTLAKELLHSAGYDTSSSSPLFSMNLMVPQPNPSRQAWAEIIENSFDDAGIDASRVILDWDTIYSKAITPPPENVGKTYAEGGFDALFVGNAFGIDPDPYAMLDSSQFAPAGQNFYLWNNSESDRLCRLIKETTDTTQRLEYVKEWQRVCYDEQPSATLLYTRETVAFDPTALQKDNFLNYFYPVWPGVEKWKLNSSTTQTQIVLAQTGPAPSEGLNRWVTTSYYDLAVYGAVFDGLAEREDMTGKRMVPALATSWEVASDQKTWTVHLRRGVTWHDGAKFNATDVWFTYDAAMSDELASPVSSYVKGVIGSSDNIEIVDEYTVVFHLPATYAYFVENMLARDGYGVMLPAHVLKGVPFSDWKNHPFNTAANSYTVNAPISPPEVADFWSQSGLYIVAAVVVVIVVVAAVVVWRVRAKKPAA
jgi:ABC-type transport system substrate-binding protein